MLNIEELNFIIDNKKILNDINLSFNNEFVVITGPNGSGKSTLAKVIAGIYKPSSGKIILNDKDITNLTITEKANFGVSFAFQQPVRFKGLTVRDLLAISNKNASENDLHESLHSVGLCSRDYIDRELDSSLSGGEIKRIEIAISLLKKSDLLIFDEPEAGIDLWSFNNLIDIFKNINNKKNKTIIVISHQERIMNIADRIVVLSDGFITANEKKDIILPDILSGNPCCFTCSKREDCKKNGKN